MINFEYKNNDTNFTLLFVHGWGVDSSYMKPLIKSIENSYSYINIDLNGFGLSPLERAFTLDDFCEEINRIITHLEIEEVYGIAHSFGGKVLLRYQEMYLLKRIILIAPSIYKPPFSLIKVIKIYGYKLFKKMRWNLPSFFKGSKDYINATGNLKETFLNVCSYYFSKKRLRRVRIKIFLIGFNKDKEVKLKSLKKAHKYLSSSELFIYDGNHFEYLNRIKEIRGIISYMIDR